MWHYLTFCSINDSAIQLGSVAGIAPLSPPPSPTYSCLSTGASPQKSNVRCYPFPLIEKDPGCVGGLGGPASESVTEKHHYRACLALERGGYHDCAMTTVLRGVYLFNVYKLSRLRKKPAHVRTIVQYDLQF